MTEEMTEAARRAPVNGALLERAITGLLELIAAQTARIKALEARVTQAEATGIKYLGVWQRAQDYGRGAAVTHGGSLWIAVASETRGEPGSTSGWQLAAKAGRDGKDAR